MTHSAHTTAPQPCASNRFTLAGFSPWRTVGQRLQTALPKALRHWLLDPGSLTAKLQRKSNGHLTVNKQGQYWGRPTLSEARALKIKPSRACLIREVILQGPEATPWVFARSVFPARSLTGSLRHLSKLDNRPLGGYLFSQPKLGRSPMQVAAITPSFNLVPAQLQQNQRLWGRRSMFYLHGKKLLVSEIFLPQLLQGTQNGA